MNEEKIMVDNQQQVNNDQVESLYLKDCIDSAFRIPVFLSTANTLNNLQRQFLDRLILELRRALLFPRTLPKSELYPETTFTSIRRLVLSSYGLIAVNFRRILVRCIRTNVGAYMSNDPFWEGSPFSQIEPAMAHPHGLPMLMIRESGTDTNRGI